MSAALRVTQAFASLQDGRAAEAEAICTDVLRQQPQHADALHLLGIVALQRGDPHTGIERLRASIRVNPNNPFVHCNLGNALCEVKEQRAALECYGRSLQLAPTYAGAHYSRGNALMDLKQHAEALASFERAIATQPNFAEAYNNRGNALLALGEPRRALDSFRQAVHARPQFVLAMGNCARVLTDLTQYTEALPLYNHLLALNPDDVEALYGRGTAWRSLRRHAEALADFARALRLAPDSVDILYRKAEALRDLGRYVEAAESFARVLQLAPHRDFALGNLLHARLQTCDWRGYAENVEHSVRAVAEGRRVYLPGPFFAVADSAVAQMQCAQIFAAHRHPVSAPAPWTGETYSHEKIRVAYVSADFREHPVSALLVGVLEQHDRRRFEIYGISLVPAQDSCLGRRVRAAFDRFLDVSATTDLDVATLLRELQIDIAVDLMGLTGGGRPGIFTHRPAPVQVSYLGYTGTTASPDLDYLIADAVVVPPTEQGSYSERVVYLPDCYQPSDDKRAVAPATPTRVACGLPERGFVFCCFNTHYKISPLLFAVWMRLLTAVPDSVLWLSEGSPEGMRNLRTASLEHEVTPERLIFAPRIAATEEHLARYRLADLFLDTLPFNAHATASEALWVGLPVLTCRGGSFVGRVAASLLTAIGLPELIAADLEEYQTQALRLATTPALLEALRGRLHSNRTTHALFDTPRYTRHLEEAFSIMLDQRRRGESASGVRVSAQPD
jgi:protein O-GlcNAc transferase